ncbi:AAA family ATPase [Rhodoferax sp. UBA5149]|uniref:AAA family ATPase n=1 Tax=Rhodoferax sp. UBA5149 TaxID=1947379 RepID=UPI0025DC127C|nr:AAA family ATPase [Rhodoferax sp. UBA5149]
MLTRLKVKGFKNLVDVDVRFGPFTCIAGPNGAGKSNLFDAITFLGDLASMPIMKAASRARGTNGRISDFHSLFFKDSKGNFLPMLFIAEMIVPSKVIDDFDRTATPTATFLEYTLELRLSETHADQSPADPIYIEQEGLRAINSSEATKRLGFPQSPAWIKQHIFGPGSRSTPFISTEISGNPSQPAIRLFGDQTKKGGPPFLVPARKSPQTIVSGANSSSHPTALAARSELRSWRLLQLEPSALRRFDNFGDDPHVTSTGEHLPAALMRLDNHAEVSQRLSELLPDIVSVDVDADEKRQVKTLLLTMKDKETYTASSLSDGTLRFLALAVLALDPEFGGLLCMEEPENGIHPSRIPQMLSLVRSLSEEVEAVDERTSASSIRQLIINTHSPLVVAELRDDELLFAETLKMKAKAFVNFKPLPGTWRQTASGAKGAELITRGEILSYLSGHKHSARSVGHADLVGRLAESSPAPSPRPSTPDLFQQAKS